MNFLDAIAVSLWITWWVCLAMFISWSFSWMKRWNQLCNEMEDNRKAAVRSQRLSEWHARLETIGEIR